jgi:hypothetical protein
MMKQWTIYLAGVLLLAAGCSSPGTLVSRQDVNGLAKLGTAPVDGTYGLFIAGEQDEQYPVTLKKGAPLGFDRGSEGGLDWLYAVAGNSRMPLDVTKTYEWRLLLH